MAYHSQPRPNVSEFIANLNAIPTAQELAQGEITDPDFSMFTNTQFFDFDAGQDADLQPTDFNRFGAEGMAAGAGEAKEFDFLNSGDYSIPEFDFASFGQQTAAAFPAPLQTAQPIYAAPSSTASPTAIDTPHAGDKRKSDAMTDGQQYGSSGFEDASRAAAEEDKRRRNTAASARFRVKKKQREQALEKSAKEMSDKVAALENTITQLQTENKWLKNLLTEKTGADNLEQMWKQHKDTAAAGDRKGETRKDGVGTKA